MNRLLSKTSWESFFSIYLVKEWPPCSPWKGTELQRKKTIIATSFYFPFMIHLCQYVTGEPHQLQSRVPPVATHSKKSHFDIRLIETCEFVKCAFPHVKVLIFFNPLWIASVLPVLWGLLSRKSARVVGVVWVPPTELHLQGGSHVDIDYMVEEQPKEVIM